MRVPHDHTEKENPLLIIAVRAAGIVPIALLVAILASHDSYPALVPHWFQPIIDKQIAVLTLSAGCAGIIGLLISTRGRLVWSTYSLFIAAVATTTVGFETIGDSTVGYIITMSLFFLIFPAVWPEKLISGSQRAWRLIWSRKSFMAFLVVASVILIVYNQYRNENYIRDWMLIPLGIIVGIIVASGLIWLLIKLAVKCIRLLCDSIGSVVELVRGWRRSR